jgi:hypothetical protein
LLGAQPPLAWALLEAALLRRALQVLAVPRVLRESSSALREAALWQRALAVLLVPRALRESSSAPRLAVDLSCSAG